MSRLVRYAKIFLVPFGNSDNFGILGGMISRYVIEEKSTQVFKNKGDGSIIEPSPLFYYALNSLYSKELNP